MDVIFSILRDSFGRPDIWPEINWKGFFPPQSSYPLLRSAKFLSAETFPAVFFSTLTRSHKTRPTKLAKTDEFQKGHKGNAHAVAKFTGYSGR